MPAHSLADSYHNVGPLAEESDSSCRDDDEL